MIFVEKFTSSTTSSTTTTSERDDEETNKKEKSPSNQTKRDNSMSCFTKELSENSNFSSMRLSPPQQHCEVSFSGQYRRPRATSTELWSTSDSKNTPERVILDHSRKTILPNTYHSNMMNEGGGEENEDNNNGITVINTRTIANCVGFILHELIVYGEALYDYGQDVSPEYNIFYR